MSRGRTGRGRRGRAEIITEEAREDGIGSGEGGSGPVEDGELPGEQREEDAEQAAEMVNIFRRELKDSIQQCTEELTRRFKGHLAYLEKKVSSKEEVPVLKSKHNQKHFERSNRYLDFILEVRAALSDGDQEAALDTLDAFAEALKQYKKDILTADSKFIKFLVYWQISGAKL